jgi:WhiB family redox-sensing transcriptional regulator
MTARAGDLMNRGLDESWRERAACRGVSVELFYPSGHQTGALPYAAALACCAVCPVAADCLAYAMAVEQTTRERHGAWGGHTPRQRTALARRLAAEQRARLSAHASDRDLGSALTTGGGTP